MLEALTVGKHIYASLLSASRRVLGQIRSEQGMQFFAENYMCVEKQFSACHWDGVGKD